MSNKEAQTHALQCLEVWGGSSKADHAASVPGLDIAVHSNPIEGDAGGDLYLISSCSSGLIARMLLADVSGHGSAVSGLSHDLRRAMHKSINTVDQTKIAKALNKAFEGIGGGSQFATAVLMTYFAPSSHLIFVNAGHPPPLIKRAGTNHWTPVLADNEDSITSPSSALKVGIRNLPLGVITNTQYEQFAIRAAPGDNIVCYTDAFIEARKGGTMLGVEGFSQILNELDVDAASDITESAVQAFNDRGIELADDDHTIVSLRLTGDGVRVSPKAFGRALIHTLGLGHKDTTPASTV